MLGTLIALLMGGSAAGVTSHVAAQPQAAASSGNAGWSVFGGNTDHTRYSTLTQINASNVSKLGVAWTASEGKNLTEFETTPVVVNGVMYYTTGVDQVRAVNPATGKLLWQYTPKVNFYISVAGGGGGTPEHRGVAVHNGVVYLTTFNDQLIALQAATGEKLWEVNMGNPAQPYSNSSPVVYWDGMVFAGAEEGDAGLRGYVAAFDAKTGKQIWKFYTVPPPGKGWMPAKGDHGGGDVWMPVVIDPTTGILYAGTGNPSPDFNAALRPGCNPWANATIALNARTGKLIWGHSEFCNDSWDYDSHQPPMLINVTHNGKTVRMVEHGNKSGKVFFYNPTTGKVIATSPYLGDFSEPHLVPNATGVKVCPGTAGGIEYSPPSYSPQTQLVYQQVLNECQIFKTIPAANNKAHKLGSVDTGGSVAAVGPISGAVAAVDPNTGKVVWKDHFSKPCIGGSLTTASGLLFAACDDGHFRAFDAKTGKVLWDADLGLGMGAAPMTYEVNGTQYVAIAAGGSAIAPGDGIPVGGTLVVFKLNGATVHKLPAVNSGMIVPVALPSLKGFTKVNPYMYVDAKSQVVVIEVTAGATGANSGFNFDGYAKGAANFVVPLNWTVNLEFANKSAIPHSMAITSDIKVPPTVEPFGFGVAETSNPQSGIGAGAPTQLVSLAADHAGKFYMACLVPGHIQSGMWDYFTISKTATMPSIQTTK